MKQKRSKGVTIFAWIFIAYSLSIVYEILTLKANLAIYQKGDIILPNSYCYIILGKYSIFSIAFLIAGIGLLKLLNWSRVFSIFISILSFIDAIVWYILFVRKYTIPYIIGHDMAIFIIYFLYAVGFIALLITIYFFTRPKVKEQFQK